MLNNTSIKTKLILIVSLGILLSSILIALLSIYTIQSASDERIKEYKIQAYKEIKNNLEKFSSIALSVIQHHHQLSNQDQMLSTLKEDIDRQMEYLFKILHGTYQAYQSKVSNEELKAMLINIVKSTRYGNSGYFWINDFEYNMIMHPIKEELTGTNFLNSTEMSFITLRKGVDELKSSESEQKYMQYKWYSPSAKKYIDKASTI